MTYNVFGGMLSLTQSINQSANFGLAFRRLYVSVYMCCCLVVFICDCVAMNFQMC